ncbi:MAG: type VI secretion system protein TssA [Myxococcota bacterium]|nr:type VI secretion system protein TssA [Myxococcota bacterium]
MATAMYDLGASPIRPDAPGGDPVRDDVRYDELEGYFQGVDAVPWDEVVPLASDLLANRGKDVLVAARLGVGLFEEKGWEGLSEAIDCWKGLLSEEMWSHVQPTRTRGRATAITWFNDKVSELARETTPSSDDLALLTTLRTSSKDFEQLVEERMGEAAPDGGTLSRLLKGHIEQLEIDLNGGASDDFEPADLVDPFAEPSAGGGEPQAEAEAEPEPEVGEAAPEEAAPAPAKPAPKPARTSSKADKPPSKAPAIPSAPAEGASLKEGMKAFRDLKGPVLATLEILRRGEPQRASCYTLARQWVWALANLPAHSDGKTSIPSPGNRDRDLWGAMAARGDWLELLHSAEGRWPNSIFWLDPHRYVAQALGALGLSDAQAAVGEGVGALLEVLPGLDELQFADGTPLADEETRSWIAAEAGVRSSGGGTAAIVAPPLVVASAVDSADGDLEFMAEVEKSLEKNKFSEAVLGFESGLAKVPARRLRFRLKLRFAQQLLAADRVHVARPILEALDEEVRRFDLENWEPELAAQVIQVLLMAMSSPGQPDASSSDLAQTLGRLRVRLARLDTLSVLEPGN